VARQVGRLSRALFGRGAPWEQRLHGALARRLIEILWQFECFRHCTPLRAIGTSSEFIRAYQQQCAIGAYAAEPEHRSETPMPVPCLPSSLPLRLLDRTLPPSKYTVVRGRTIFEPGVYVGLGASNNSHQLELSLNRFRVFYWPQILGQFPDPRTAGSFSTPKVR
jgi:hypothetical protein